MPIDREVVELKTSFGGATHNAGSPHNIVREKGTRDNLMEYVVSGGVEFRHKGSSYTLKAGDIFIFTPYVRQDYGMAPEWEHCWASFSARPHWKDLLGWPELFPGLLYLHIGDPRLRKEMTRLFEEGIKFAMLPWRQSRDLVLNQIERILLWADTINPEKKHALLDNRIRHVLQYMADHHAEFLTMEDLAARCNLSPSRFAHLFRKEVRIAPLQYLNGYRINRAKEMLRVTGEPISEIAFRTGFQNPLYFSRIFRQITGSCPRDYRRQA